MAQDCVATLECTIAWSEHRQEPPTWGRGRAPSPGPPPRARGASAAPGRSTQVRSNHTHDPHGHAARLLPRAAASLA